MEIKHLGAFLVYANGEFEMECKTVAGTKRCVSKLQRLGLTPSVRRHVTLSDGWTMNIDCKGASLAVQMDQEPVSEEPDEVAIPSSLIPTFVEVRSESQPDGLVQFLSFAVRVF